jgi:transcriptional regulator of met regulon
MFKVTNKNGGEPSKSPFTSYLDAIDRKEALANIDKLVNSRELSTDDEIYHITGTIAQIEKISEYLHVVTSAVPQAIQVLLEEERQQRQLESSASDTRQEQLFEKLDKDRETYRDVTKQAIDRSGKNINTRLRSLCWSLGGFSIGMLATSLLAYFVVFPQQLRLARGSDGAMLEWLSTSDGKILRRTFTSGNRSVEECIRKGLKKTGKTVCLLEIK